MAACIRLPRVLAVLISLHALLARDPGSRTCLLFQDLPDLEDADVGEALDGQDKVISPAFLLSA